MRYAFFACLGLMILAASPAAARDYDVVGGEGSSSDLTVGVSVTGGLDARAENFDDVETDEDRSLLEGTTAFNTQVRLGAGLDLRFDAGKLPLLAHFEAEGQFVSGYHDADLTLEGVDLPGDRPQDSVLRSAWGRVSIGPFLHIGGGLMTSTWGLGLIANDGSRVWEPGSAAFVDPRGGDAVARLFLGTGPFTSARVQGFVFADKVERDDNLVAGDDAEQFGGGLRFGEDDGGHGGVYIVSRSVEAEDAATLDITAFDAFGSIPVELEFGTLTLAGEGAYIVGDTTFSPSVDFPTHKVRQLAGAARGTLAMSGWGLVLDAVYASGDRNLDDEHLTGFKIDRNYEMGLQLFRQVLGAQSGRAPVTAADPELVGFPAEDLDRIPTQGSVTNTVAFFPRAYWQPTTGLELYGGPLIAFANVDLIDPRNTRLNGGEPRNAVGGRPGGYLGTELDVGVRGYFDVFETRLSAGLEGGVLFAGSALQDISGETPDPTLGGRAMVRYQF